MDAAEDKLQEVIAEFDCQTGTLHKADDQWLFLVTQEGVPEPLIDKISKIPFGKGIAGVAAERKDAVELCNLQQDLEGIAKEGAKKTGVSGSIAVPILSQDNNTVLGTLGIGKFQPYQFSDQEKSRLTTIAKTFIELL